MDSVKYATAPEIDTRRTTGHELFHHVQYGYINDGTVTGCNSTWSKWACEGTARMMQDEVYADLDADPGTTNAAYVNQINGYLTNTGNLNTTLTGLSYNAALFWRYLSEQLGSVATEPQRGVDAIVAFWQNASNTKASPDSLQVLRDTISGLQPGMTLEELWQDFVIANYAKDLDVSALADADKYGYIDDDATPYGSVATTSSASFSPSTAIGPAAASVNFEDKPFTKDQTAYAQDAFYPKDMVSIGRVERFRDLHLIQLNITAAQYNPKTKMLKVYDRVDFEVEYQGGTRAFLTQAVLNPFESYVSIYQQVVLNGQDLTKFITPDTIQRICFGSELLVITHPNFKTAADTLATWKRDKGITTSVHEVKNIQVFIRDRYNTCSVRPSYVLLLSDAEFIPPSTPSGLPGARSRRGSTVPLGSWTCPPSPVGGVPTAPSTSSSRSIWAPVLLCTTTSPRGWPPSLPISHPHQRRPTRIPPSSTCWTQRPAHRLPHRPDPAYP